MSKRLEVGAHENVQEKPTSVENPAPPSRSSLHSHSRDQATASVRKLQRLSPSFHGTRDMTYKRSRRSTVSTTRKAKRFASTGSDRQPNPDSLELSQSQHFSSQIHIAPAPQVAKWQLLRSRLPAGSPPLRASRSAPGGRRTGLRRPGEPARSPWHPRRRRTGTTVSTYRLARTAATGSRATPCSAARAARQRSTSPHPRSVSRRFLRLVLLPKQRIAVLQRRGG